jgi:VWFA-related protein
MSRAFLTLSLVACASAAGLLAQSSSPSAGARLNTVYVTAVEGNGAPVLDLAAADFTVKEDGKTREVVRAEVARVPMHVALVVDDNGTGIFRSALVQFVQQLQGRAQMALHTVMGQTHKVVDYKASLETLTNALGTLTARPGTPDGGQLLEGIFEASKDQERLEVERPVIVALTVGGEEHSTLPAHHVLDQLARSGSTFYVVQVTGSSLRPSVPVGKPSALLEENLNLSEVLGEGPKQSGGQRVQIVATPGVVLGLQRIANELKTQYAVAYNRDGKSRSTQRIAVATGRSGVTLRAPSRVPGR